MMELDFRRLTRYVSSSGTTVSACERRGEEGREKGSGMGRRGREKGERGMEEGREEGEGWRGERGGDKKIKLMSHTE